MNDLHCNPLGLFVAAANVPDFGPVAELAKAVCMMRGQHAYDTAFGPFGSLPKWQAVILETMLVDALRARSNLLKGHEHG